MLRIKATPKNRSRATHAPNATQVPSHMYSPRSTDTTIEKG